MMATDGEAGALSAPNFLDNLDGGIIHVLRKAGSRPTGELIDQLDGEFDEEIIEESREFLSKKASERYLMDLESKGLLQAGNNLELLLKKRRGISAKRGNAEDVIELYYYMSGLKNKFPKDSLSSTRKFVDTENANQGQNSDESSQVSSKKLSDLYAQVAVLANSVRVLKCDLENERKERCIEARSLKEDIVSLKNQLCTRETNHIWSEETKSPRPTDAGITNSSNSALITHVSVSEIVAKPPSPKRSVTAKQPIYQCSAAQPNSKTENVQLTSLNEMIGSKEGCPESTERAFNDIFVNGGTTPNRPESKNSANDISTTESGELKDCSSPETISSAPTPPSYSEILQVPGDWSLYTVNKKQLKKATRRERNRQETGRQQQTPPERSLKGCRQEKTIQLYLEHIQMDYKDTD